MSWKFYPIVESPQGSSGDETSTSEQEEMDMSLFPLHKNDLLCTTPCNGIMCNAPAQHMCIDCPNVQGWVYLIYMGRKGMAKWFDHETYTCRICRRYRAHKISFTGSDPCCILCTLNKNKKEE